MLGHLVFDNFLVSCGTCREALREIGCDEIFGCAIVDVAQFVMDNASAVRPPPSGHGAVPHPLPRFPRRGRSGSSRPAVQEVKSVANCCSEAGTLAISRPDIAHAMLERKRESLTKAQAGNNATIIATNCPSCLSGLGRNREMGLTPRHMAVVLAETLGGQDWMNEFARLVGGAEKVTF